MILYVDENDEGKRIDIYLADILSISRSKVQNAIKSEQILVNLKPVKSSLLLRENDKIDIEIEETNEITIKPENTALEIVYEDDNMAVVNKPSGMLTHPTVLETEGTLVNALLYKYGDNLSDINGTLRRGIVHRLDRDTSGLLMIAKNNKTHEYLSDLIKTRNITKKYHAVLKGNYPFEEDTIDLPIGRNERQPNKMAVVAGGKDSVTKLKVIKRYREATYVELTLLTGRTHQIRVHTSFKGYPVYNDTLYGAGLGKVKTEGQVLQSFYLRFTKPFKNDIIELSIEPDGKIKKVLKYFENRRLL